MRAKRADVTCQLCGRRNVAEFTEENEQMRELND